MAGIIKAHQQAASTSYGCGTSDRRVRVRAEAEAHLEDARRQAEQIVCEARREADHIRRHAQQSGEEAAALSAQATLETQIEARTKTVLPALEQTIQQFNEASTAWCRSREQVLIQLSRKIAERILRRQLQQDPMITVEWAREALELVARSRQLCVRLNPRDHAAIGQHVAQLAGRPRMPGKLEVVSDASVDPGGCLVQYEHGEIDLQLQTQLDRMEEELAD